MSDPKRARADLPLPAPVFEILLALSLGPAHGYAIIKQLEEQSAGDLKMSTSSLYAALRKMESAGLVEPDGTRPGTPSGGPPRRYFRISAYGHQVARLEAARLKRTSALAEERLLGGPATEGTGAR